MKNNDAELIQRVLEGDDDAFSVLVRKYQEQVHALAWRKIGDFHIAEEITQDTFLNAYKRLSTLHRMVKHSPARDKTELSLCGIGRKQSAR